MDNLPPEPPESMLGLGFHAIGMMMDHLTEPKTKLADLLIVPELQDFESTDYRKSAPLVQRGYEAGVQETVLDRLNGLAKRTEVLPDRVTVLADVGELATDIDADRAEKRAADSAARLKALTEEEGYAEALASHQRNLPRQAVSRKNR